MLCGTSGTSGFVSGHPASVQLMELVCSFFVGVLHTLALKLIFFPECLLVSHLRPLVAHSDLLG